MNLAADSVCPRCGSPMNWHEEYLDDYKPEPGPSMTDGVTLICAPCFSEEKIDKMFSNYLVPQSEWFAKINFT